MIEPDRTQAPPFRLSSNFTLSQPECFTFPGGQKLFAFRGLQQHAVKLDFIFQAGKWFEPMLGVSYFTSHLLAKGTHNLSSFQIASALDHLGAHLEIVAGYDHVVVSLSVLNKNLAASMKIVQEILRIPSFDENELRQEKEIFLQNLRVNNQKPSVLASKEIRKTLYGSDHPYGSAAGEQDIKPITAADLQSFFHERFIIHSAYLVGKVSDDDLDCIFQAFPPTTWAAPILNHQLPQVGASHHVEKSGSVQASIRLAKRCLPKRADTSYYDAVMFNLIVGGFFGSRLMKNIREEKGLTYGIHSGMNHFLHDSFWVISAEVNQQHVEQALTEIRKEIKILQNELVTGEELELARNYYIGSWQSDNNTLFAVAEKVKNIHWHGLPDDYYNRLLSHIQNITPLQIQEIAQVHFDLKDLVEVRVG